MTEPVQYRVTNRVAWLTISRPEARNALSRAVREGMFAAQTCDLVIAADTAQFAVSEVKVGLGSPWAAPLPWPIPPRVAMQILLTGDPISAERAYQVDLVNEVVPTAELPAAAQALGRRIAANVPLSVLAGKRTVYLALERPISAAFDEAERIWKPVYLGAEAQKGPAAFRDRRTPVWKGR